MLSVFGGLFGFKMGVINSLTGDSSYNENSIGGSFGFIDALDFIITFVALPFQALIDNTLSVTLRVIMGILGILNLISLAFYIRGFI